MRRQWSVREKLLLALLIVILVISGYISLFYMPMTSERDRCIGEAEQCRIQTEAAQVRLEDKRRMERELEEIFSGDTAPVSIASYNNLQPVMRELNEILRLARNYSLNFGTVDASQTVVRRQISISFTTDSYASAKEVLSRLHDSAFRCMLNNISVSLGRRNEDRWDPGFWLDSWDDWDGDVAVSGTIVYFEYQENSLASAETADETAE